MWKKKKCELKEVFAGALLRTDVDDVPLAVEHQVAVVAIFDLQQETHDRIRGHALDEVGAGLRKDCHFKNGQTTNHQHPKKSNKRRNGRRNE